MTTRRLLAGVGCFLMIGCVQWEQPVPALERLPGTSSSTAEGPSNAAFVGLELEESLASSLEAMSFEPGLSVVSVAKGSPAQLAGIRRGDRVVSAEGVELERVDQWGALLEARGAGDTLTLTVERGSGLRDVALTVAAGGGGVLPVPIRHRELWKGRLEARSELIQVAGQERMAARVVTLLPESPFESLAWTSDTVVLGARGQPVAGAAELVEVLARSEFGEEVEFEFLDGGQSTTATVELWAPPRHLTRLAVPILFGYQATANDEETEFTLLDLWIFSLFQYEREGQTRSYRFLRWFEYQSGVGELLEVTEGASTGDAP